MNSSASQKPTTIEPRQAPNDRGGAAELLRDLHHSLVGIIRDKVSPVRYEGDPPGYMTIDGEDDAAEAIINHFLLMLEGRP